MRLAKRTSLRKAKVAVACKLAEGDHDEAKGPMLYGPRRP